MDYSEASKIRNKSFGSLLAEQEGGALSSLSAAISQKTKARMMGIKETFDPLNLAKKLTFGSNWAPALLGKLIGAALVGTFLGILLAYAIVSPIAKVLEQNAEADSRAYMAVKAILIASLNNFPPAAAVEFGRKVLFSYQRPSFAELDEGTKAVKGK